LFLGHYQIVLKGKKDERLRIRSDIVIRDRQSKISVSKDGEVEISAENEEKLDTLKLIAQIACRRACAWRPFELRPLDKIDLRTGRFVSVLELFGEVREKSFTINKIEFKNTVERLRSTSSESLLFLTRSTDLLGEYSELSALLAFLALELELGKVVPDLNFDNALAVLKYIRALPKEFLEKLRTMHRLRNALAHGDWRGKKIGERLNDLLGGGPFAWTLRDSGRMSHEASREIVKEVSRALALLSTCRTQVDETLKKLRKKRRIP